MERLCAFPNSNACRNKLQIGGKVSTKATHTQRMKNNFVNEMSLTPHALREYHPMYFISFSSSGVECTQFCEHYPSLIFGLCRIPRQGNVIIHSGGFEKCCLPPVIPYTLRFKFVSALRSFFWLPFGKPEELRDFPLVTPAVCPALFCKLPLCPCHMFWCTDSCLASYCILLRIPHRFLRERPSYISTQKPFLH